MKRNNLNKTFKIGKRITKSTLRETLKKDFNLYGSSEKKNNSRFI